MKVFRCESPSAGIGFTRLNGSLTPLYETKNRHSRSTFSVILRAPSSIRMDHDFHRVVEFVERIGHSIFLDQRNATEANVAIDHGQRDRLQAPVLARSLDAQSG